MAANDNAPQVSIHENEQAILSASAVYQRASARAEHLRAQLNESEQLRQALNDSNLSTLKVKLLRGIYRAMEAGHTQTKVLLYEYIDDQETDEAIHWLQQLGYSVKTDVDLVSLTFVITAKP